jgi:hypothetical protein
MTIITTVLIEPLSAEVWPDLEKQLATQLSQIASKHGVEIVTMSAGFVGGQMTKTIRLVATAANWTKYGQVKVAVYGDPDVQAKMAEAGKNCRWQTYVSQSLELGLERC